MADSVQCDSPLSIHFSERCRASFDKKLEQGDGRSTSDGGVQRNVSASVRLVDRLGPRSDDAPDGTEGGSKLKGQIRGRHPAGARAPGPHPARP